MLDSMSCFPAPPKSEVVAYIVAQLRTSQEFVGISDDDLRLVAAHEYDHFGSLGSLAAWMRVTAQLLLQNTTRSVRKKFAI